MQVKKERKKIKKKNYNKKNIFFVPPTGFEPIDIAPLPKDPQNFEFEIDVRLSYRGHDVMYWIEEI